MMLHNQKPTEAGYYWHQPPFRPAYIEEVFFLPHNAVPYGWEEYGGKLCTGGGCQECLFFSLVENMEGTWSDKIPEPENVAPLHDDDVPF